MQLLAQRCYLTADNWMRIHGATSAEYRPNAGDLNYCLRAVAEYNDGFHEGTASTVPATAGLYLDTDPGTLQQIRQDGSEGSVRGAVPVGELAAGVRHRDDEEVRA